MSKKIANKSFILFLLLIFIMPNYVKAAETINDRSIIEDYVVSTALSYYYNQTNTDYEGYWAEESESVYSTNYNITPEMLSRSRRMTTQCDAFVTSVYMHSLGYDFSNFKDVLNNNRYTKYRNIDGSFSYANSGNAQNMKTAYKYFNKVYDVGFGHKIAVFNPDDAIVIATYQTATYERDEDGKVIKDSNNCVSKNLGVDCTTTKSITKMTKGEQNTLVENLKKLLRPGDIILNNGHAMLWVGNAIEQEGGIIHSTGNSFAFKDDRTFNIRNGEAAIFPRNGYDVAGVWYSSLNYLIERQVKTHNGKDNDKLTVLRPINAFQSDNGGFSISSIQSNTKARTKFKNLKIEEYVYNSVDKSIMSATTASSVNKGDTISYKVLLKNKSGAGFCSAPMTSSSSINEDSCIKTKESCLEKYKNNSDVINSYCNQIEWKTDQNNNGYSNITIVAQLPENTEFVDCNNCVVNYDRTISWYDIEVGKGVEKEYYYTVKTLKKGTVKNNPIEIGIVGSSEEYILKTGEIETKVADSMTGKYKKSLEKLVNRDLDRQRDKYDSSKTYIVNLYSRFYGENSQFDENAFTNILNANNIVKAIFVQNDFDKFYTRKTKTGEKGRENLDDLGKTINKMLVSCFYGGKKYEQLYGDFSVCTRSRIKPTYYSKMYFNYGDIIVTMKEKSNNNFVIKNVFLYTGDSSYTYINNGYIYAGDEKLFEHIKPQVQVLDSSDGTTKSKNYSGSTFLLNELYSADLYVVLRPSQVYGKE